MSFTPAPWNVFPTKPNERPGVDALGGSFSVVVFGEGEEDCGIHGRTREEAEANAHLIAAAPDLLAALKALVDVTDGRTVSTVESNDVWAAAVAVIAKAEGR